LGQTMNLASNVIDAATKEGKNLTQA